VQVHFGLDQLRPEWDRSVVCIGTFDGVHLGHQSVIGTAVREADAQGLPATLVTFDRHPAAVLAPDKCPAAIAGIGTNLREFERLGAAVCVLLPFTKELSQTPAEAFFQEVLLRRLLASEIVVGHDFAFGKDRQGTPEWLCERIKTKIVPPFLMEGVRVSSSAIRAAVTEGRVEDARRWLGRPFELGGVVGGGERLGRELGYPTLNLARSLEQVVPGDGVYAADCATPFGVFRAAASVGNRETVGGTSRAIEAHLLDYPGNSLYGRSVGLRFLARLRDQVRYNSVESLIEQLARDVEACRGVE
jgi:riboflavin kinase/FMN adenylyltransferase